MKLLVQAFALFFLVGVANAQEPLFKFGKNVSYESILFGQKSKKRTLAMVSGEYPGYYLGSTERYTDL